MSKNNKSARKRLFTDDHEGGSEPNDSNNNGKRGKYLNKTKGKTKAKANIANNFVPNFEKPMTRAKTKIAL